MLPAPAADYTVKLDAFEGPLDLLLFLVRREEVELWDIPLERITGQFLDYLARAEELDIHLAGDFIVMAATLIYILVNGVVVNLMRFIENKVRIPGLIAMGSGGH